MLVSALLSKIVSFSWYGMIYLHPKNMQHNSPKLIIIAIKAIILHTFGVQVR